MHPFEPDNPEDPVAAVERAVGRTEGIAELPMAEHVERFESAHAALSEALGSIDKV